MNRHSAPILAIALVTLFVTTANRATPGDQLGLGSAIESHPPWVPAQVDQDKWQHYVCDNCISALALAPDAIWVGTFGAGVVRWDPSGGFRRFTETDGLPSDWIHDLDTSPDGSVWIGTTNGAAHFDGAGWTVYQSARFDDKTTKLQHVLDVEIGPRVEVWAVGGAIPYVFYDSEWTFYSIDLLRGHRGALVVRVDDVGNRWFGTDDGLVWDDGLSQRLWRSPNSLSADIVIDIGLSRTGPWVAALPSAPGAGVAGVSHFDGVDWTRFTADNGLTEPVAADVSVGKDGRVWLAHNNWPRGRETRPAIDPVPGATVYDGKTWAPLFERDGLPYGHLSTVTPDLAGGVWFTGVGGGIGHNDEEGWSYYLTDDGPVGLTASAVALDPRDGSLWSAHRMPNSNPEDMSAGVGLSRFDGQRWQHVVARDGYPGDMVGDMAFDAGGNLWLATMSHGALRYDGASWTRFVGTDGLVDGGVTAVARGVGDDMWFGTAEGVFRFDGAAWRRFTTPEGLSADAIETIVVDDHGDVLAGTTVGLDRYDGSRWESIPLPPELSATVSAIAADSQGGLWVAPRDEGYRTLSVAHHDADHWTVYSQDQGKNLFSGFVSAIAVAANGDVWFTDSSGALRFDGETWARYSFHEDPTHTNLDFALDVVASDTGEVWIGHGIGVSVYRGEAAPAPTPTVTSTLLPTPTATSTEGPGPEPTPSHTPRRPDPVAECVCSDVLRQVPQVVIHDALANPKRYYGWRYPLDPGKPRGPGNPLRECLSLRSRSSPYHPLFNSAVWRTGCP